MTLQSFNVDFGQGQAVWHKFSPPVSASPDTTNLSTDGAESSAQGNKKPLHFASANGIPAASYDFFLKRFAKDYDVFSLDNRGVWPSRGQPDRGFDWPDHTDDLIAFLDHQQCDPVIGMGHSIGATVTVFAAIKRPDLFERLILVDPASTAYWLSMAMMRLPGVAKRMGFIASTARRRAQWPDRQTFIDSIRTKQAYEGFTEQALSDYAEHGLIQANERAELELTFAREWEAHNFTKTPWAWGQLKKVKCPVLFLRGEHSYLHREPRFSKNASRLPANIQVETLSGLGHLAIQQGPELVEQRIKTWLSQ